MTFLVVGRADSHTKINGSMGDDPSRPEVYFRVFVCAAVFVFLNVCMCCLCVLCMFLYCSVCVAACVLWGWCIGVCLCVVMLAVLWSLCVMCYVGCVICCVYFRVCCIDVSVMYC